MAQTIRSLNHNLLLQEFYDRFHQEIRQQALDLIGVSRKGWLPRCRRWLLEPFIFTLEGRKNFFRTALSVAMGELIGKPGVGWIIGATGEIAWTCALLTDDLIDGSQEREGHVCAHMVYGRVRTFLAINFALWRVFFSLITRPPVSFPARIRMVGLSIRLLLMCVSSQLPVVGSAGNLKAFYKHAERVNNSNHWALVAPAIACGDREIVAAAWEYATAIAINGKMQNDLLDYCGGSTESETLYRDFKSRYVTFPILVLLEQEIDESDRDRIERYFSGHDGGALTVGDLNNLFLRYRTFQRCLDLMRDQMGAAVQAVRRIESRLEVPEQFSRLLLTWTWDAVDWAEERIQAWRDAHG
ncbi:MAG TPA: polyprenyl synthetase family protein [Blastocatellia bacterium]|nr:polyprenyl synthetase family protein [Blastocatellia bacterium]